jgi:hypothetical protein
VVNCRFQTIANSPRGDNSTASFTKFNQFCLDLCSGIHNLATGTSDTFYCLLTLSAPSTTDTAVNTSATPCQLISTSSANEIAAGNNYTKGGLTCGTVTGAQASGTFKFTLGTDPVWTATNTVGPFQYVVLYNSAKGSAGARPVIGFWNYGSNVTLATGETFTVDLDQTNGVLTVA